ncbi:crocetin glucosyltransferase, chloroplastic-like [Cucurbita pepo subsp. pepo]|uniref:crocetin glucosyltransferase, chloroplastic-like n=1 Tax=Cucurbita pepo subsp. pepo TaxID=3664 RepID=UPI000C9D6CEE|nr:crocetin glucosyltransferase, chloroplastic-like [Cucurbita pepo subsp. pepo]
MRNPHFLLVCFPSQGYINPSLQLAKRLIHLNIDVTFATTIAAARRMNNAQQTPTTKGLSFATFSDGFDDDNLKLSANITHFFSELKRCGSQSLTNLITSAANKGRPFTFLIYGLLLNWAADIATSFNIPSALFFAQPATVLALYFHYFHGYEEPICNKLQTPSSCIELPNLPLFTTRDMPSFFSPCGPHAFIIPPMREQLEFLGGQTRSKVLVNTFDTLETDALRAIDELKMIAIGPLIPSSHDDGGNLFHVSSEDYIGWLSSKAERSVVYVSFGSICELCEEQEEEVLNGLLESGRPFMWVVRSNYDEEKFKKVGMKGKIVSWCRQIEVLKHPSVGCFVSHCGWNSTIESLSLGVAVVGFPQQIDQMTNAKLVEDLWKTGVRVKGNSEGVVERGEIRRCLDLVMGNEEIERNVKVWKQLGRQAVEEGGSSTLNLQAFVSQIDGGGTD